MTNGNCPTEHFENGHFRLSNGCSPVVRTSYGDVIGFRQRLNSGVQVDVFLGIPFARPPIGELRFEKPVPPLPWTSSPLRALSFGPAAIPLNPTNLGAIPSAEDCLQLNIFRPAPSSAPFPLLLPVMVYIHGGGFADGSARQYGFEGWAENFAPEGILVVTVQYRLGPFGFLSFGRGTVLPGNLGLWDICQALRFVHDEIRAFGGDPDRVTVVGLSAGGAAAAFMALSPHTRDLVCGSVELSGTALAEWSASDRTEEASREFVRKAMSRSSGAENGGGEAAEQRQGRGRKECQNWQLTTEHIMGEEAKRTLKAMTADQIVAIAKAMGTSRADPNLLVWGPRVDGDFLPSDIPALVREGRAKPVLMGVTAEEAIYFTIQAKDPFINPFGIARRRLADFGADAFRSFVHNVVLGGEFRRHFERESTEKLEQMLRRAEAVISAFYLCGIGLDGYNKMSTGQSGKPKQQQLEHNNHSTLEQYTRLVSDLLFVVPLFRMAQLRCRCGVPTFLYFNEYFNESQFEPWTPFNGATHGNEYPYLNGLFPVGEFQFRETDRQHRAILVQMLSTFIHTGTPSVTPAADDHRHFLWPPNGRGSEGKGTAAALKFVRIGNAQEEKGRVAEVGTVEAVEQSGAFWTAFSREFGFDLVRGIAHKGDDGTGA